MKFSEWEELTKGWRRKDFLKFMEFLDMWEYEEDEEE